MKHTHIDRKRYIALLLVLAGIAAISLAIAAALTGVIGSPGLTGRKTLLAVFGVTSLLTGLSLLLSKPGSSDNQQQANIPPSRRLIAILGGINVAYFTGYAVLTYAMAPVVPPDGKEPYRAKLADQLAQMADFLGPKIQALLRGQSILAEPNAWFLAYAIPLLISTAVFLALVILLARHRHGLDADLPQRLFRWAAAFAAISALALPVLVLDFWYPLAWGRMVAAGLNPYYTDIPVDFLRDLPLGEGLAGVRMMYGPLWAMAYGVVMWFAGSRFLLAAFAFKVLFAAAWIGSLRLIWALLRDRPVWHQCLGLAIFGWLPVGVIQGVAEGHNDVFVVFFVLLWLYGLKRRKAVGASLSLTASILVKYVTAPLFLLDLMHCLCSRQRRLLRYAVQVIPATVLAASVFGLFFRSMDFFSYLRETSTWRFFSPEFAARYLLVFLLGRHLPLVGEVVRAFFVLLALWFVIRYRQDPCQRRFWEAALAVMSAMLFGVSSHMWPWYILWVLGLAALVPGSALTRWVIGVALATPFPLLIWVVFPGIGDLYVFEISALLLYSLAIWWFLFAPHAWFPGKTKAKESSSSISVSAPLS